ncbi:hypothetical protein KCP75_20580 [Salmonella enterica subsp. enterica]|nr:hypothetical protein KCP75_20580 [Salmonella enterica subsp. enterica]
MGAWSWVHALTLPGSSRVVSGSVDAGTSWSFWSMSTMGRLMTASLPLKRSRYRSSICRSSVRTGYRR